MLEPSPGVDDAPRTCRVCFDEVSESDPDVVQPCECLDAGRPSLAHRTCVQKWISTRPNLRLSSYGRRDLGLCEVCSKPWRQQYELPDPPAELSVEELESRANWMLFTAYARSHRIGGLQPRDTDQLILNELGPHFDGPWNEPAQAWRGTLPPALAAQLSSMIAQENRGRAGGGRSRLSLAFLRRPRGLRWPPWRRRRRDDGPPPDPAAGDDAGDEEGAGSGGEDSGSGAAAPEERLTQAIAQASIEGLA